MAFIGKNVIENLTTAMYENLLIVYREYIQNSADAIDKAVAQGLIDATEALIDIQIDMNKRFISIEDNGTGIGTADFKRIMSSIADSTKDAAENKGFRGIGRLGGISTCRELRFSCSIQGEAVQSIVIWDAKKVRDILNDDSLNPEASTLVDSVTFYDEQPCEVDKHFFKVEMIDIEKSASELLDVKGIKDYLGSVAPLPYAIGFIFNKKIHEFARENGFVIDEYNVFVNGDRLFKEYRTKLYEDKNGQKVAYDELQDVKFEVFAAEDGLPLAWMWYGVSRFEKAIPVINIMRGIRLRKGNIQIGNELTFSNHGFYKETRGYSYYIGEVFAVHPDLRPNARRDYFNLNDCCREFEHKLRDLFFNRMYTIYHRANQVKKAYQAIQTFNQAEQEYRQKQETGFVNDEEKEELEAKIEEQKKAVARATKTLETRDKKEEDDDVLTTVYGAIKKTYCPAEPESKTDSTTQSPSNTSETDTEPNPYKSKAKYITKNLSQYSRKEQKLIGKIYGIIKAILPRDTADLIINKIQEELSK